MRFTTLFFIIVSLGVTGVADDMLSVSGDMRMTYVDYNYDNGFFPNSNAAVISGKLSAKTQKYNGLYAKASFTTVQGINHDKNKQGMSYIFSETWAGVNDSFSLLEESYIGYENDLLHLKLGRQEINTPYIDADDYFVTPNSFEALTLQVRPSSQVVLDAGHVTKMSGTWDASYDGSDFHSMSRQAWIHYSDGTKDT